MWLDDKKYAPGRKRVRDDDLRKIHELTALDQAYRAGFMPVNDTPTGAHMAWSNSLPVSPWSPGTPAGFFTPPVPAGMDAIPFTNLGPTESRPFDPRENMIMPNKKEQRVQQDKDVTDFASTGEAKFSRKKTVKRGITIAPASDEALAPDIPDVTESATEAGAPAAAAEQYVSPSAPLEKTPPATAKAQRTKRNKGDKGKGQNRTGHPVP
jgi:hypothetical protein